MKKAIALTLLVLQITTAHAEVVAWMATKIGSKAQSNGEVENYIERAHMADQTKMLLFKEAGSFEKYQTLKSKWLKRRFESGLKKVAYNALMQEAALSEARRSGKREFFTVRKRDLDHELDMHESRVLKQLTDKGMNMNQAKDEFAKFLKESGYPHKAGSTLGQIYYRWYDDQREKLTEVLREQEVKRFESFHGQGGRSAVTGPFGGMYIRPDDMFDFYKRNRARIETLAKDSRLNGDDINTIIQKNPDLGVILKSIRANSLSETGLAKYLEQSPDQAPIIQKLITSELAPQLGPEMSARITKYIDTADTLAKKRSGNELSELSEAAMKRFMTGEGDYNDFMLARLYDIAISIQSEGKSLEEVKGEFQTQFQKALDNLAKSLGNLKTFAATSENALALEDLVANHLSTSLESRIEKDDESTLAKSLRMGIWVVKFSAKKIALKDKGRFIPEILPINTFATQDKITKHLRAKEFEKNLKAFQRKLSDEYSDRVILNIDGETTVRDSQAMRFIFDENYTLSEIKDR